MITDTPAQQEAGSKRRDDGSLYIQLKSLPGFHFILPNNEDVEVALLPALEHFLGLYFSRILSPTTPANPELDEAVGRMRARKDAAYLERNYVVAALASLFPSGVARTSIEGWDADWHGCVYIDLPTGQVSWHFHDSHERLFGGLPAYTGVWDGHDTPEKYRRLATLGAHTTRPGVEAIPVDTERFGKLSAEPAAVLPEGHVASLTHPMIRPKEEASDLERARDVVRDLTGADPGESSPWGDVVASALDTARRAGRDEVIKELREHPEILRAKLKQHPSYSCECLDAAADYLAANKPSPEPSE